MCCMDQIYGSWTPPPIIQDLIPTEPLIRLRGISQDTLPASLLWYSVPSRFLHDISVSYLANIVCAHNPWISPFQQQRLIASALLHDAGSPAFSHGSEPFLLEMTGKNGEQFLEDVLQDSDAEIVLRRYNLTIRDVVSMVTGEDRPFAEVLCGSLDIDNTDNVFRYIATTNLPINGYDPRALASAFRYDGVRWALDHNSYSLVQKWLAARERLYCFIYESPRMIADAMLQRALTFAYDNGEITREFFFLTDEAALVWLEQCNPGTLHLITRMKKWQWYERILNFCFENDVPPELEQWIEKGWRSRNVLADEISHEVRIHREQACVFTVAGRERREITLPFIDKHGQVYSCWMAPQRKKNPIYRLQVFVAPEIVPEKKRRIASFAKELCGIAT